jgi:hypothetical protein
MLTSSWAKLDSWFLKKLRVNLRVVNINSRSLSYQKDGTNLIPETSGGRTGMSRGKSTLVLRQMERCATASESRSTLMVK